VPDYSASAQGHCLCSPAQILFLYRLDGMTTTSDSDIDRLFREGVAAIRAGDKASGREKLMEVVERDQMYEQAWLWLSAAVDTNEDRVVCLENVLTINPANEVARRGLEKLRRSASPPSEPAPPPPPLIPDPPIPTARGSLLGAVESTGGLVQPKAGPVGLPSEDQVSSPASPSKETEEEWRKPVLEAQAEPSPEDRPLPQRNLLDLLDAWAAALVLLRGGAYRAEVLTANFGRVLVNLAFGSLLSGITLVLFFVLVITPLGGIQRLIGRGLPPEFIPSRLTAMAVSGIAAVVIVLLMLFIGSLVQGTVVHFVAEAMGGKGSFVQTLHAWTIAFVAEQIAGLLPVLLLVGVVFAAPSSDALSLTLLFSSFILALYRLAAEVNALRVAHPSFSVFRALGIWFVAGLIQSAFCCCLGFVVSLLGR
jgi:hypothetical protein